MCHTDDRFYISCAMYSEFLDDAAQRGDSYFPLAIGNRWHYEWCSEDGDLLFKGQERVVLEHEGKFYPACSGYTTNVREYGEYKY